jgi:hypothetical protein
MILRNLDWLWRLFLYSSNQPAAELVRVVQPTIDTSVDWPLVPQVLNLDYSTIVGTQTVEVYAPSERRHGLVTNLTVERGGGITANDVITLVWDRNPSAAPGFTLVRVETDSAATDFFVPLIGGMNHNYNAAYAGPTSGIPPVYIPSGFRLVLTHASTGVAAYTCRARVYELSEFYPIPHALTLS